MAWAAASVVSGIYRITNTITGDWYIGSSTHVKKRWADHRARLRMRVHTNLKLQAAWDEHGEGCLTFTLLEEVAPADLFIVEQRYLTAERPPYNIQPCARGGPKLKVHSAKTRALISERVRAAGKTEEHKQKLREHIRKVRVPGSPERCRKMAAANKGKKRSAESIARMSLAQRGHPVSDETRKKIGDANRGHSPHAWSPEQRANLAEKKRLWWAERKQKV